jgi:DNA replication protein DnaC
MSDASMAWFRRLRRVSSPTVLMVGEPGTGKSHLATGLAIAACRQRRRVRFITAAALVNQLVDAQREQSLSRMLACRARVELIVIDELGYVLLAEVAAELLFERPETPLSS